MCTHLEENYLFPHRHTQTKNLEKVPENPFAIVENNKKKPLKNILQLQGHNSKSF